MFYDTDTGRISCCCALRILYGFRWTSQWETCHSCIAALGVVHSTAEDVV